MESCALLFAQQQMQQQQQYELPIYLKHTACDDELEQKQLHLCACIRRAERGQQQQQQQSCFSHLS
jgi:hypothetical protein